MSTDTKHPEAAGLMREALEAAVHAMRAPFDGWKGELEAKALALSHAVLSADPAPQAQEPNIATVGKWLDEFTQDRCGCFFESDLIAKWADQLLQGRAYNAKKNPQRYVLLELSPQTEPVYFVVRTEDYWLNEHPSGERRSEVDAEDARRYSFDEHSCPANWLPRVVRIASDIGDAGDRIGMNLDPHGLLRFVRSAWAPPMDRGMDDEDDQIQSAFPEIRQSGWETTTAAEDPDRIRQSRIDGSRLGLKR